MKTTKVSRDMAGGHESEDSLKRAAKLDPIKKSGKERHHLYDQDDDDLELYTLKKRRSAMDYYDDGDDPDPDRWDEEEEEWNEEEIDSLLIDDQMWDEEDYDE